MILLGNDKLKKGHMFKDSEEFLTHDDSVICHPLRISLRAILFKFLFLRATLFKFLFLRATLKEL